MDISEVQSRLRDLGFDPGPIDGLNGPQTSAAIIAFKRSIGLRGRAYLGPRTLEALMGEASPDAPLQWLAEASAIKGIHESRDVSRLRLWLGKLFAKYDPREVAWCGAFVATCLQKWSPDVTIPLRYLAARSWATWGDACTPQLGAVMVFWRGSKAGWQGHVAFYWGEDNTAFHVIGGNQSDAVTITRISKDRLLAARWPTGTPKSGKIVRMNSAGQPLSTNEA